MWTKEMIRENLSHRFPEYVEQMIARYPITERECSCNQERMRKKALRKLVAIRLDDEKRATGIRTESNQAE